MSNVRDETIQGVNRYIQSLRDEKNVGYVFSLTLFDTVLSTQYITVPLSTVKDLTHGDYITDGWTALYDAIGRTIRNTEASKPKVDKVLTVIQTDGHENSSKEFTFAAVREMIERKEKEGNWTFVFLGATMDAYDVGVSLGVRPGNAMRYDPSQSKQMFETVAASTSSFSNSSARSVNCLVSDEHLQKHGGVFRK